VLMPSPVRIFGNTEMQVAMNWLAEAGARPTLPLRLVPEAGVLVVEPDRAFTAEDFDDIARTVDPWIEMHGSLQGVVIHTKRFPGWKNFDGIKHHLNFMRSHHGKVHRVAVATPSGVANVVPALASRFLDAELKRFPYDHLDDAIQWAGAASEQPPTTMPGAT
jgi:hypothetical protein